MRGFSVICGLFFLIADCFCGAIELPKLDVEVASPIYSINLSKLPPIRSEARVAILPNVLGILDNIAKQRQVDVALVSYLSQLNKSLPDGAGTLLRFRMITDQFGNTTLPYNFLVPIGAGMNPTDAYSEYLNRPTISIAPPDTTATDTGYFLWIKKQGDARFNISAIPREFTSVMLRESTRLAAEKTKFEAEGRPYLTFATPDYAARAQYWSAKLVEREASFASAERLQISRSLQQRFDAIQHEHSRLVQLYEERKRRQSVNNAFLSHADTVLSITSAILERTSSSPVDPQEVSRRSNDLIRPDAVINKKASEQYSRKLQRELDILERQRAKAVVELNRLDAELLKVPDLM